MDEKEIECVLRTHVHFVSQVLNFMHELGKG